MPVTVRLYSTLAIYLLNGQTSPLLLVRRDSGEILTRNLGTEAGCDSLSFVTLSKLERS